MTSGSDAELSAGAHKSSHPAAVFYSCKRDFVTRGRTATHAKDLDNAIDAARRLEFHAPVLEQVASLFHSLAERQGDPDDSALLLEIERLNSIKETSG